MCWSLSGTIVHEIRCCLCMWCTHTGTIRHENRRGMCMQWICSEAIGCPKG